jgi:hypothetical protein
MLVEELTDEFASSTLAIRSTGARLRTSATRVVAAHVCGVFVFVFTEKIKKK